MLTADLRTRNLEEAITALTAYNEQRLPVITKTSRRALRRMRELATTYFQFRVPEERRTLRRGRQIRRPIGAKVFIRPDLVTLEVGSSFAIVKYFERGAHEPASEGRAAHERLGHHVRRHALRLNIPATRAIRSATDIGVPRLIRELRDELAAIVAESPASRGGGASA